MARRFIKVVRPPLATENRLVEALLVISTDFVLFEVFIPQTVSFADGVVVPMETNPPAPWNVMRLDQEAEAFLA